MDGFKLSALLVIFLAMSGCATTSRFQPPLINIVSASGTVTDSTTVEIAATCPDGQPLLGGGYLFYDLKVQNAVAVLADFPRVGGLSSSVIITGQWVGRFRSVSAGNGPIPVLVVAYCYARQKESPITIEVPRTAQAVEGLNASIAAPCPSGFVLTSGGFENTGAPQSGPNIIYDSTLGSYPASVSGGAANQSEWKVDFVGFIQPHRWSYTTYAVCASGHFSPNSFESASAPLATISPIQAGDFLTNACSGNSFTSGAGYLLSSAMSQIPHNVTALNIQNDFSQAHMTFDKLWAQPPPQLFAVCLNFSP